MKLNVNAINFEIAERLSSYIEKKTRKYNKILSGDSVEMEIRLNVVKPETNLNKETLIRVIGTGSEMFVTKTCDTFEEGIDLCLEAIDRQIERQKSK